MKRHMQVQKIVPTAKKKRKKKGQVNVLNQIVMQ